MKKFRVLLLTFVVAVTMMAGSLSVFAADGSTTGGDLTNGDKVPVSKTVKVADGTTFSEKITIKATHVANSTNNPACPVAVGSVGPFSKELTVTQAAKTTPVEDTIDFSSLTKPGLYTFSVVEETPTAQGGGTWSVVDTTKYYLQVLVKSDGTKQYALSKGEDIVAANSEDKADEAAFDNTYVKTSSLEVSKAVVGDYADLDQDFDYEVTFHNVAPNAAATVTWTKTDKAGATTTGELSLPAATAADPTVTYTFKLKATEKIVFSGLPTGATYDIKETGVANYKAKATLTTGSATSQIAEGALGADISKTGTLIDEGTNKAEFTNTYQEITITGVIMNVLPFVMMIAIAGAAAAMYVVSRRRKMAR